MEQATFDDFMKLDIRVGTIVEARPFEKARRPAYQLLVDLGPELGQKALQRADHPAVCPGGPGGQAGAGGGEFPAPSDRRLLLPGAGAGHLLPGRRGAHHPGQACGKRRPAGVK